MASQILVPKNFSSLKSAKIPPSSTIMGKISDYNIEFD